MITMAQYHDIRRMYFREGKSIRRIANELKMSRRTIGKYLNDGFEPSQRRRKQIPRHRSAPVVGPFAPIIKTWLADDLSRPPKQRHTGRRIYERLAEEYGFIGAESTVRRVVGQLRREVKPVYIPLEFPLGDNAQCDWGEVQILLNGTPTKVRLFVMRLTASRALFVRAYPHERQEAFFDGHCRAFRFFGGVPQRVTYDNLKTAVKKVLRGRNREEQEAFQALRAHYVFQAEFCNVASGNEKGQVECMVGYSQRNFFVPLPEVDSLDELNTRLAQQCLRFAEKTRLPHSEERIASAWARGNTHLLRLPERDFDACRVLPVRADHYSLVHFETNAYSIPCAWAGRELLLKAYVDEIRIIAGVEVIAVHRRCYERKQQRLHLDHFIDALAKKPRALRDAAAFQNDSAPPIYRRFYLEMRRRDGAEGDRAFIRILQLHRQHGAAVLVPALTEAEAQGLYHYDVVAEFVRRQLHPAPILPMAVGELPERLADYAVAQPDIGRFNRLLGKGAALH
ncbi:IS21 family transposase [Heliobacterium gestii]|uniref:IS21 family transposase n=1 Tax=Heliomicrobium gestii TaxID=2699 RepID=A0A845LDP5_HELGE|nr:IS21 family transposase [Heliomicrobium gestii]MBM7867091.1 transposase [Heliomicrobium gestii]MZP43494.1 IS21 family transposase [Heliomicrobium gestii]